MNLQQSWPHGAAVGLEHNCIYLPRDGEMRSCAKTAEFYRRANKDPGLTDGHVLALHQVNGPQDVHFPVWEMHPHADELLILVSGSLSVEFRGEEHVQTAPFFAQSAFIVPAGTWHRLIVYESSMLIAITPRHNTVHER